MKNFNFKIHLLYNFQQGPWGGGNQFLKTLRNQFIIRKIYEENFEKAEVLLFNSYHKLLDTIKIRIKYPNKLLVHRLGPIFHLHRGERWKIVDKIIIQVANKIADLVVFQSNWSYKEALKLGFKKNKKNVIIGNSVDDKIFNELGKSKLNDNKIKLISDSWSPNWKKGFKIYKYLDEHLDFNKYEMIFIGKSPIKFKNIKLIKPLSSKDLARKLKKYDIFISAVEDDACSNSIIEALACGLPVAALNSGGNADIIKDNGELSDTKEELIEKIDLINRDYFKYKSNIKIEKIEQVANKYLSEIEKIRENKDVLNSFKNKLIPFYYKVAIILFLFNIYTKMSRINKNVNRL